MQGWLRSRWTASVHCREPLDGVPREPVGARHLLPDHEAQPVGPVQVARVLDLLVLAHAVEAHGLGQLDVAAQRARVGRGQAALRPVALVEDHAQGLHPPVQQEPVALDAHRAQGGVAAHLVDLSPRLPHSSSWASISVGLAGLHNRVLRESSTPGSEGSDPTVHLASHHAVRVVGEDLVPDRKAHVQPQPGALESAQGRMQPDAPVLEARRPSDGRDVGRRHRLHPHRLPDAGRARVPDGVRLLQPVLLPAGLGQVQGIVLRPHDQLLQAASEHLRHVRAEGRVAAFVAKRPGCRSARPGRGSRRRRSAGAGGSRARWAGRGPTGDTSRRGRTPGSRGRRPASRERTGPRSNDPRPPGPAAASRRPGPARSPRSRPATTTPPA